MSAFYYSLKRVDYYELSQKNVPSWKFFSGQNSYDSEF